MKSPTVYWFMSFTSIVLSALLLFIYFTIVLQVELIKIKPICTFIGHICSVDIINVLFSYQTVVTRGGRGRGGRGGRGGRKASQSPSVSSSATSPVAATQEEGSPAPATGDEVSAALEAMEISPPQQHHSTIDSTKVLSHNYEMVLNSFPHIFCY